MAHLLSTANPDEAARLEAETPQAAVRDEMVIDVPAGEPDQTDSVWHDGDPDVGDWVIYQPRRGMVRRGRNRVAALVVHRHPHARLFDLAIFYEANDTLDDQRVPEAMDDERGWLVKSARIAPDLAEAVAPLFRHLDAVRQEVADIRALILGEYEPPPLSVLAMLDVVDERVDKLERAKPKQKRKYTRMAKPVPEAPKAD